MATPINNTASSTYTLSGSDDPSTITSNTMTVELNQSGGITLTKTASPTTFGAGDIITYTVKITNSGSQFFNGVRIIDDLGGGNMAYVVGSASLTAGSTTYPVSPVATSPLTFTLQELNVDQSMTLTYKAQVFFSIPGSLTSITNTVQGIGYTASGTVTGFASSTITKKNSSSLTIVKSASLLTVVPNQSFTYYITLSNSNSMVANVSNITDQLPANFNLTSVKLQIGSGSQTTLPSSSYTLSGSNLFVVPSATGPVITVPANGTTVLSITGYFS